jgi:hypothetical protein
MVGAEGFEPPTLCSQSRCATRLRYAPIIGLYRNQRHSGLVGEPLQEPEDEEDRGQKDDGECRGNQHQEDPVSPRLPPGLLQMANNQRVVATVRLPGDIKGIAQQRNRPQEDLDADVHYHSDQRDVRHAAHPGREHDDRRRQAANDISQARDEADDAVQSEAYGGAGDAKPVIEYVRQEVEIFVRKEAARLPETRGRRRHLGRQDLGLAIARHT